MAPPYLAAAKVAGASAAAEAALMQAALQNTFCADGSPYTSWVTNVQPSRLAGSSSFPGQVGLSQLITSTLVSVTGICLSFFELTLQQSHELVNLFGSIERDRLADALADDPSVLAAFQHDRLHHDLQ